MTSFENLVMSINEFFFDDFYTKLNDIVNSSSKLKKDVKFKGCLENSHISLRMIQPKFSMIEESKDVNKVKLKLGDNLQIFNTNHHKIKRLT